MHSLQFLPILPMMTSASKHKLCDLGLVLPLPFSSTLSHDTRSNLLSSPSHFLPVPFLPPISLFLPLHGASLLCRLEHYSHYISQYRKQGNVTYTLSEIHPCLHRICYPTSKTKAVLLNADQPGSLQQHLCSSSSPSSGFLDILPTVH
jgi:hypothetical protein